MRDIAKECACRYVRRELNNLGAARDQALHQTDTEFLAFVDADVELPSAWAQTMQRYLADDRNADCSGVASVLVTPLESAFDRAMALALSTPLTHLGATQAHRVTAAVGVRHLATAAVLFRRQRLIDAGGFSSLFSRVCEDLELSYRLLSRTPEMLSSRLVLLPQPAVIHRQDQSLSGWACRVFRYGWGQIEVARVHHRHIFTRKIIPLLVGALGAEGLGLALSGRPMILALLAAQYLAIVVGVIVGSALVRHQIAAVPRALVIVAVTHVAYILGMWAGVAGFCRNPRLTQSVGIQREAAPNKS